MRRKGKPKAKTKTDADHHRPKSAIDCDTHRTAGGRFEPAGVDGQAARLIATSGSGHHHHYSQTNATPLISVSIASASPSSQSVSIRDGINSSDDELITGDRSGAPQARPADDSEQLSERRPQPGAADGDTLGQEKDSDCVVVLDNESQTSQTNIRPAGSHLSSGIELVKQNYIRLMGRNNLIYFYLGSFLYSVINMIFLLTFLGRAHLGFGGVLDLKKLDENGNDGENGGRQVQSLTTSTTNCDSPRESQSMEDLQRTVWLLLASLFLVTIIQVTIIVLEFYIEMKQPQMLGGGNLGLDAVDSEAGAHRWSPSSKQSEQPRKESDNSTRLAEKLNPSHLNVLGIFLSLLIIVLPVIVLHIIAKSSVAACAGLIATAPPIILISVLVYILPNLTIELDSSSWSAWRHRLIMIAVYLTALLPWPLMIGIDWIHRSSNGVDSESLLNTDELNLAIVIIAAALIAGQVRQRLRTRFHRVVTFERANELIEAKVSLEQQRQQQETLLLSVLPAYVAEQVKRNMLKKMDSLKEDGQDFGGQHEVHQAPAALFVVHSDGDGPVHSTTTHTPLYSRSFTLPSNCEGPPSMPNQTVSQQPDKHQVMVVSSQFQRRSFAKKLWPGSSFTSNYLTASKTNAVLLQQNQQQPDNQQTLANSQQETPTNPPPVGLSPVPIITANTSGQQARRGFNELYIRTYNNVSLLYGDIVGFTRLCTQLSSWQLVRVLNNLFSYFDYLAEQHKIMRIKILGDCYYGVSGIPEFAVLGVKSSPRHAKPASGGDDGGGGGGGGGGGDGMASANTLIKSGDNHAINCVNMGLDMIQYIKCLNFEREPGSNTSSQQGLVVIGPGGSLPANFELNMRIGIHTGHIHSGVIGLKKWQFDVWSNDVSIAMHCESSGVAGRVQVTEATIQHLRNAFTFEPATRSSRDTFLADRSIRTYLIVDRVRPANQIGTTTTPGATLANNMVNNPRTLGRSATTNNPEAGSYSLAPSEIQEMDEERIREATIGTIRQTLLSNEPVSAGGPVSAPGLARLDHNDMSWWTLEFKDPALNVQFQSRAISTVGYLRELYVLFLLLVLLVQTINYHHLTQEDDDDGAEKDSEDDSIVASLTLMVISSLVITLALMVAGLPRRLRQAPKGAGGGPPYRRRSLLDNKRPSYTLLNNPLQWLRNSGRAFAAAEHNSSATEDNMVNSGFVSERRNELAQILCGACKRSKTKPRRHIEREANNLVSVCSISATFALVILVQFYLMKREFCLQTQESSGQHRELKQWRQMTIMVLLFALDLSPSLLTYRLRAGLLAGFALFQLVVLCASMNPYRRSRTGGANGPLFQQLFAASRIIYWICGAGDAGAIYSTPGDQKQDRRIVEMVVESMVAWSNDALLFVLALWSLAFNRQLEYSARTNFLWRNRLNVDHEELEYISGVNKVLLENILPSHVVQHYLDQPSGSAYRDNQTSGEKPASSCQSLSAATCGHQQEAPTSTVTSTVDEQSHRRKASQAIAASNHQLMRVSMSCQMGSLHGPPNSAKCHELYHEQHESVAVMFASIPHFYEFYDESDISKQGLGCIALLNEIICDFDKLLLKNKFSRIEKIKTIGSTYMAAAGLRPSSSGATSGRNSNASQVTSHSQQGCCLVNGGDMPTTTTGLGADLQGDRRLVLSQQKMNLICMIQFATSLMSALNGINKQSFQVFKLRVGVNSGAVVAGIIGAQRPFYDIWGDCVNIASRMESLGEVGRIQVEEKTAMLLSECLCPETYIIEKRGPIDVKGKGGMVTYFVDKRQQSQQQTQQQDRNCAAHESSNKR